MIILNNSRIFFNYTIFCKNKNIQPASKKGIIIFNKAFNRALHVLKVQGVVVAKIKNSSQNDDVISTIKLINHKNNKSTSKQYPSFDAKSDSEAFPIIDVCKNIFSFVTVAILDQNFL